MSAHFTLAMPLSLAGPPAPLQGTKGSSHCSLFPQMGGRGWGEGGLHGARVARVDGDLLEVIARAPLV